MPESYKDFTKLGLASSKASGVPSSEQEWACPVNPPLSQPGLLLLPDHIF